MSNNPKFRLGIAMAGAVSAGAYTAGVIDYLLETLRDWQTEKDKNRAIQKELFPDKEENEKLTETEVKKLKAGGYNFAIPMHDVVIEVLGGASAGAMTAAVTTLALCTEPKPISTRVDLENGNKPTGNLIYDAWVNLNDGAGLADSTLIQMFGTEDLDNEKKLIPSLLNSKPILRIGQKAAQVLKEKNGAIKKISDYPYISDNLEIILSLCSLRGIPIQIGFEADAETQGGHRMKVHKLYAHFGIGENPPDHVLPFDPTSNDHLNALINCAVASGAFPFGLSSVQVREIKEEIEEEGIIPSPDSKYLEAQIRRLFSANTKSENNMVSMVPGVGHFATTVVDGGTINNEPFGEVLKVLEKQAEEDRHTLEANIPEENPKSDRLPDYYALLMIDPFPNDEKGEKPFEATESIEQMLLPLFGAVRGQAMVKEKEITAGFTLKHTRGLIKPKDGDKEYPIASGSLGGFGGFFSKEFREHDFFLGRKNCQSFLRKHFFIDKEIIEKDEANLFASYKKCLNSLEGEEETVYQEMYDRFAYMDQTIGAYSAENVRYPIIPDMKIEQANSIQANENGKEAVKIPDDLLNPQIEMKSLLRLKKPLRRRVRTLFFKLIFKMIFKKKNDKEIALDHERKTKLLKEKVILPDPKSGCLYVYDQNRYDLEVAAQKKVEDKLEAAVDKIVKRYFKAPVILHYFILILAIPFLAIGALIVLWPLINMITEKVFRSIVTDFKKRGLLVDQKKE